MGVRHQAQCRAFERLQDFDDGMGRVAHAQDAAQRQLVGQRRRQGFDGHEGRAARGKGVLQLGAGAGLGQAHLAEDFGGGHAARVGAHAVHQRRHAFARQQQRQQRRQVGQLARAVVAGDEHRRVFSSGAGQRREGALGGVHEAGQLLDGFALDAHGKQNAAEFEVRHAVFQHGAI